MPSSPVDRRSASRHILLITSGWRGLLYSGVELARRLANNGHRITYAAPSEARQLIAEAWPGRESVGTPKGTVAFEVIAAEDLAQLQGRPFAFRY